MTGPHTPREKRAARGGSHRSDVQPGRGTLPILRTHAHFLTAWNRRIYFCVALYGGGFEGTLQPSSDADFWRKCAIEARARAEAMTFPAAKRQMEFIAAAYECLADHAEHTAGRRGKRQPA